MIELKKVILTIFCVLLFLLSPVKASLFVESFDAGNQKLSIPHIRLKNAGSKLSGFKLYYYFSAADTKDILIDSYYLPDGTFSLNKVSNYQYQVVLDFKDVQVDSGQCFPQNGNLQFGLHYSDWSDLKKEDDYSFSLGNTSSLNEKIVVESSDGVVLFGKTPSKVNLSLSPVQIKMYANSQSENNYGKYQFYAKNEGNSPVANFDFDVEFVSENGNIPIIDEWFLPNTTFELKKKDSISWIIHFSVRNVNLEPGSVYPSESGFSFGIHYVNWSEFDESNDYSLSGLKNSYSVNEKVPVYVDGKLIFGSPKIHDYLDIKKILAEENEFELENFEVPLETLLDTLKDVRLTWDSLARLENVLFENIPNFDTTSVAFFQILEKFPGLDTLFLVENFKGIKAIYERVVQLKMLNLLKAFSQNRKFLLYKKTSDYEINDTELTSDEFWSLFWNPMRIPGSRRASNFATEWAQEYAKKRKLKGTNPNNTTDNRADGFRHSVWNALLCRETGTQFDDISECLKWAEKFSTAHEQHSDVDALSTLMDFHNNELGRDKYSPKLKVQCEWNWGFTCVNEEVVGPSREETKKMYSELAENGVPFNDAAQLGKSPWIRAVVFFRDDNGSYYCPTKENCVEFVAPVLLARKIGVLKKESTHTCNEEFSFRLDLEDDENGSRIVSGDPNPPGIIVGSGGVSFTYCVLNLDEFDNQVPRVPYDYIVLRMDRDCPNGTYAFARHHDTEDSDNSNSVKGNSGPSSITKNATLEYCFVPADTNSTLEFPFDKEYGVFANHSSINIIHTEIFMDDEDSDNSNAWKWYDTPDKIQNRIKNIMNGSSNTIYYVIKWIELVWNKLLSAFEV